MATTTLARVRLTASHLRSMADADLQAHIDDAALIVSDIKALPSKYLELAERYLSQHLATLNKRRPSSQSLDGLAQAFQATKGLGLQQTEFGQQYEVLTRPYVYSASFEVM